MSGVDELRKIAQDTIQKSKSGEYTCDGKVVTFDNSKDTSIIYEKDFYDLVEAVVKKDKTYDDTRLYLKSEGTVDAVFRLCKTVEAAKIGVLNFASAYNAGGGFITGAMAQEECLAYCSNLYLNQINTDYYVVNKAQKTNGCYTDTMLLSGVTFFKDSAFELVPEPKKVTVLTAPAVNMSSVLNSNQCTKEIIESSKDIMRQRMYKILYAFASAGCTDIILGAYGCGVFGNDPKEVASVWLYLLNERGMKKYFKSVTFSILGKDTENFKVFLKIFGGN